MGGCVDVPDCFRAGVKMVAPVEDTGTKSRVTTQATLLNLTEAAWHTGLYTALSLLFFTLVISMVMMLVNARGQGLHDYFLGTTAINRPKP